MFSFVRNCWTVFKVISSSCTVPAESDTPVAHRLDNIWYYHILEFWQFHSLCSGITLLFWYLQFSRLWGWPIFHMFICLLYIFWWGRYLGLWPFKNWIVFSPLSSKRSSHILDTNSFISLFWNYFAPSLWLAFSLTINSFIAAVKIKFVANVLQAPSQALSVNCGPIDPLVFC